MIRLITYTDERMTISASKLIKSALDHGANEADVYLPADLSPEFKEAMKDVLAQERGAGFYCWKPWVIAHAMQDMETGDYLIWSDAGTEIVGDLTELTNAMTDEILFFSNGWRHIEWCKMDLIAYCFPDYITEGPFSEGTRSLVDNAKQVQASHIIFQVSKNSRMLVDHWLDTAMRPHLVDNSPSELPNVPTFQEHRWDQSILCCLQIMYNYALHWFPSTMAMHIRDQHPEDKYPAVFNHHRRRNNEW